MTKTKSNIPFFKPSFSQAEEDAVIRVIRSGWLTTGKEALSFEEEFAHFVGSPFCLAVNSATSGLLLSMEALGIRDGVKILTTPYTFVSTVTSALHLGAHASWVDIEENTYNISPELIEKALKKDRSIKAIVPVHFAGNPCKMKEILDIASRYEVSVIEDAAHAFPSRTSDGFLGTLGDAGVFSFYATKTITTGEGGMICVRDKKIADRIKIMRSHGIDRTIWDRYTSNKASWEYDMVEAGWKCNLPDILAAIGREQLKKADVFFQQRKKIAECYNAAFKNLDFIQTPPDSEGNAWHLYPLRIIPEKLTINRNEFAQKLQDEGLGISVHFIPHCNMTWFKKEYGLKKEDFPNATRRYETTISLPFWPGMNEDEINQVISTVTQIGMSNLRIPYQ